MERSLGRSARFPTRSCIFAFFEFQASPETFIQHVYNEPKNKIMLSQGAAKIAFFLSLLFYSH